MVMSQKILNSSDFFAKIQIFCYHFFIYKKLVKILLKIFYGKRVKYQKSQNPYKML